MFLAMLRDKYLDRNRGVGATFHSVILAGVTDVKNLKFKMVSEGAYERIDGEGISASPWNIASDFEVDMSFNPSEIATMLSEYEDDNKTGMDINVISQEIYNYTDGYPYLVSRICQHIDNKLNKEWTLYGVQGAVKIILKEENTLFDDLFKNLENNDNLYNLIYDILIVGQQRAFSNANPTVKLGLMYGIIKEIDCYIVISNRIFEIAICNYFVSKDEEKRSRRLITGVLQYDIVYNGRFNMELCLEKFAQHYKEIFDAGNVDDVKFLERHGRMVFLSYLKPLINGQGFYHIESQFTDLRRMDIVVDFGKEQFIIELKIWHGNARHIDAYEQLIGYLDSMNTNVGYLLTFDFRKNENRDRKPEWVETGGKRIFDVVV